MERNMTRSKMHLTRSKNMIYNDNDIEWILDGSNRSAAGQTIDRDSQEQHHDGYSGYFVGF